MLGYFFQYFFLGFFCTHYCKSWKNNGACFCTGNSILQLHNSTSIFAQELETLTQNNGACFFGFGHGEIASIFIVDCTCNRGDFGVKNISRGGRQNREEDQQTSAQGRDLKRTNSQPGLWRLPFFSKPGSQPLLPAMAIWCSSCREGIWFLEEEVLWGSWGRR